MSIVDKYAVTLTFTREVLGTNPLDPAVHDQHIINKQRELISEHGNKTNREINRYLEALQISSEKGDAEVESLISKLEELIGKPFTPEERTQAIKGELASLKQTLAELELKGATVFFRDANGMPCIGDHMIKGFLKAAGEAICRAKQTKKKAKDGVEAEGKATGFLGTISGTSAIINQHLTVAEQFISFDKDVVKDPDGNVVYLQRSLRANTAQGPRVALAKSEVVPAGAKISFTLKVMKGSALDEAGLKALFEVGEITGIGQWRNASYGQFTFDIKSLN